MEFEILPQNPDSKLITSFVSVKETERPSSYKKRCWAPENEMPAQQDIVFVSCRAFLCSSQKFVLTGPLISCTGRRLFFVWMLSKSRNVIPFEVATLMFDCPDSLNRFSAGSPFVRCGLAYPRASIEPQPQASSIRGNQISNNNRSRILVQTVFRILNMDPGGFFVSEEVHHAGATTFLPNLQDDNKLNTR